MNTPWRQTKYSIRRESYNVTVGKYSNYIHKIDMYEQSTNESASWEEPNANVSHYLLPLPRETDSTCWDRHLVMKAADPKLRLRSPFPAINHYDQLQRQHCTIAVVKLITFKTNPNLDFTVLIKRLIQVKLNRERRSIRRRKVCK